LDVLIERAHDVREKEICLVPTAQTNQVHEEVTPSVLTEPVVLRLGADKFDTSFEVTGNWIVMVERAVDPFNRHWRDRDRCVKSEITKLHSILATRLNEHILERVEKQVKRDHWCWHFVRRNLSRISAIMLLLGHVRKDLECTSTKLDLLRNVSDGSYFVRANNQEVESLEGCYLYRDEANGYFVRSGKVIGRSFLERHKEHVKCAMKQDTKSRFYRTYPAREAVGYSHALRHGYIEDLAQYCGLGFSRTKSDDYKKLVWLKHGILDWDEKVMAAINPKGASNNKDIQCKQYHLVGYLFECCYDLAIAPCRNVSENPGFESFLGEFKNGQY
jgi:hypothetical protein